MKSLKITNCLWVISLSLDDVFKQSPMLVLVVDIHGNILYFNDYLKKIYTRKSVEKSEVKISYLIPKSKIISAIKNKQQQVTILSDDLYLLEIPISDQKGIIFGLSKEIVQLIVHASPELVNLKKDLEAIMNLSGELVTITDGDGMVQRVNRTCEKMMGVKEKDFVGKSARLLQQRGVVSMSSTLQVLATKRNVHVDQVTKSGRRLVVQGFPIFDEDGRLSKVINISKDVTEMDSLKKELEETQKNMQFFREELNKLRTQEEKIIIKSKQMEEIYDLINRVADFDATIFIEGETGVGKEVIARKIHDLSNRNKYPFIKVNCGAVPESLMESEFFGYAKGTFTGGNKEGKQGIIEAAHHGTLFLDEIGELPLNLQTKLLQVLQEKEFTPLGETKAKKVDIRFIAATNRDLKEMVKKGEFREDLYYRLYVIPIHIPPLRERKCDIPFLASHFLDFYNKKYHTNKTLDPGVVEIFMNNEWKGNVRELQNIVERLVLTTLPDIITKESLPESLMNGNVKIPVEFKQNQKLKEATEEFEREFILKTLTSSSSISEASRKMGVDVSTLSRKIKKYGIGFA